MINNKTYSKNLKNKKYKKMGIRFLVFGLATFVLKAILKFIDICLTLYSNATINLYSGALAVLPYCLNLLSVVFIFFAIIFICFDIDKLKEKIRASEKDNSAHY